jgi:hypothetical protein
MLVGIVVACSCGQAFEADLYLAGKVVQCPSCRSPLAVPSPADDVPATTYVPRQRSGLTREAKEANESLTTILVVGGVLLFAVVGISIGILCFVKGANPLLWARTAWEEPAGAGNIAPDPSPAAPAGPIAVASSPTTATPTLTGLPEGWIFSEHPMGRFSALLPDFPTTSEQTFESLTGSQTSYTLAVTKENHVFEATRAFRRWNIEQGQEAATYDGLLKKRASELEGGKIEGSHQAMVDGRLVCDGILRGKFEGTEVRKYVRFIATGDSVFELSCRVPPGHERAADIKLFLGNYKLQ